MIPELSVKGVWGDKSLEIIESSIVSLLYSHFLLIWTRRKKWDKTGIL